MRAIGVTGIPPLEIFRYTGSESVPLGEGLSALPVSALWR